MRLALVLAGLVVAAAPAVGAAPSGAALAPEARDRLVAAVGAYRAGQYPQAARQLGEAADAASPIAEYALYLQADSLARAGESAGAHAAAVRAAERAGEGPLAPLALQLGAREALRAGQAAAAAALYRRALDRAPDLPEIPATRLGLGQALEGAGQATEAARAYRELWLGWPASDEAPAAAARERALTDRGVALAPPTARERVDRAERLLAAGRASDARAEADVLLGETPAGEVALRALRVVAEAARRLGRPDDALRAVDRALALSPPERRAPWLLERGRLTSGRLRDAALATFERLARDHPQSPEAPEAGMLRAELLEAMARPAEAEAGYRRVVQDYPDDDRAARALWRLGWLAWLRGDLGEAAQRWSRLGTARGPLTALREGALYWAGRAHEARGERAEAERLWAPLLTDVPRGYYGLLAARRAGAAPAPAAARPGGALPADPIETLRGEARWGKVEALREVGLGEFVPGELDELARRGAGDPVRLYAVSAAHVQDRRYHLALRIRRREFVPLARRGDAATPRAFWETFYPIGWRTELEDAAAHAGVDPILVAAVAREESSYDPRARSRVGARGLMQLMPDTARPMAAARGLAWEGGALLEAPRPNLELGAAFLATLVRDFGDPRLAVAAYNAGPRRVREWWAARRGDDVEAFIELIPFNETRFFVKRVTVAWEEYARLYGAGLARPGRRP